MSVQELPPTLPPPPGLPLESFDSGDRVGPYQLVRYIHRGAFGEVWIGYHTFFEEYRAVKIVPANRRGAIELSGIREYKRLADKHSGLIPIEDFGQADSRGYYYAMPLADDVHGTATVRSADAYEPMTLSRYNEMCRPLSVDRVLAVSFHLLPALHILHEAGYVHRDIKPANILRVGGVWKLCDMGLLARRDQIEGTSGTPGFMPPEGVLDRRADIYAFGITLFLLATDSELKDFPQFVGECGELPGVDERREPLREIIRKACHAEPAHRFQTSVELQDALLRLRRFTKMTIVLDEDYSSFETTKLSEFLAAIRDRGFHFTGPPLCEQGSVKVTLEVPTDEAEQLADVLRGDHFRTYRVIRVEWHEASPALQRPVPTALFSEVSRSAKDWASDTPLSLLSQLQHVGHVASEAWQRFDSLYRPLLMKLVRRAGIREQDAEDVVQQCMVSLMSAMPTLATSHRPFRSMLSTVVRTCVSDFLRRIATRPFPLTVGLPDVPAPPTVEELCELEYRNHLVARALELIRPEYSVQTWSAFTQFMLDGRRAEDVASEFGMSVNAVYLATHRIISRVRIQLSGLLD